MNPYDSSGMPAAGPKKISTALKLMLQVLLRSGETRMKKKVSLILQCRLSSTRLKGKALLPLGNGTVLSHVLLSMKKVPCDDYVLATDKESAPFLKDTAEKFGYELYTGSLSDVLSRYTGAIKKYKSDVVVRGTCDNPFLF